MLMQPTNTIDGYWREGEPTKVQNLTGLAFTEEAGAHTFRVHALDSDGAEVGFTGGVTALFLRADNKTFAIDGTADDGPAEVTLVSDCYHVPGRFSIAVYVSDGEVSTCVYAAVGSVYRTTSDVVMDSGAEIPTLAQLEQAYRDCVAATEAAQDYVRIVLPPLTRHIFPGVNENLSVASGTNLRTASIIYNTIYSEGHDRTGSTYQNVVMTVETPFRTYQPSNSNCVFQSGWFRTFTPITDTNYKMVVTLDGMTTVTGATTNPPLICVATYDPETYQVAWNDHPSYNSQTGVWSSVPGVSLGVFGYRRRRFVISECLANGNMCVMVIFRRPTHEIDWTISVDVVNATYETWVEDLPVETMDACREHWTKYIDGHAPEANSASLMSSPLNLNTPLGDGLTVEPEETEDM